MPAKPSSATVKPSSRNSSKHNNPISSPMPHPPQHPQQHHPATSNFQHANLVPSSRSTPSFDPDARRYVCCFNTPSDLRSLAVQKVTPAFASYDSIFSYSPVDPSFSGPSTSMTSSHFSPLFGYKPSEWGVAIYRQYHDDSYCVIFSFSARRHNEYPCFLCTSPLSLTAHLILLDALSYERPFAIV